MGNIRSEIKRHALPTKLWTLDSENQILGSISSVNVVLFQNVGFVYWLTNWRFLQGRNTYDGSIYTARQALDYVDTRTPINWLSDIQSIQTPKKIKSMKKATIIIAITTLMQLRSFAQELTLTEVL